MARSRRVAIALLTLGLIETAVFLIYTSESLMLGEVALGVIVSTALLMIAGDATLDLGLLALLFATERLPLVRRWTIMTGAIALVTVGQAFWDTQVRVWTGEPLGRGFEQRLIRSLPINLYAAAMTVLLLAFQMAYLTLRDRTTQLHQAHASERATQLAALRLQLNPHFLFNALNSLSSLIVLGRSDQAEEMIAHLSDFLRASIGTTRGAGDDAADGHARGLPRETKIRLGDEYETIEAYLEIERVRFRDRMEIRTHLPAPLRSALIPTFILQPLVENAVKYGVSPCPRTVTITIGAAESGDDLVLWVHDDGDCPPQGGGTGVGLGNVRERLALLYGPAARLATRCEDDWGYEARITLPLQRAPHHAAKADAGHARVASV